MDDITNFVGCKNFENWLKVAVCVRIATVGIKEYVNDIIKTLMTDLKTKCGSLPQCNNNCSKQRGLSPLYWCPTCRTWNEEITKHYHDYQKVKKHIRWNNIQSTNWPNDVNEIIKVFMPDWWNGSPITSDFTTAITFCYNCSDCKIPRTLLDAMRDVRNDAFHQKVGDMEENEMYISLTKLTTLLQQPVINSTKDAVDALDQINVLKNLDLYKLIFEQQIQADNQPLVAEEPRGIGNQLVLAEQQLRIDQESRVVLRQHIHRVLHDENVNNAQLDQDSETKKLLDIWKQKLPEERKHHRLIGLKLLCFISSLIVLIAVLFQMGYSTDSSEKQHQLTNSMKISSDETTKLISTKFGAYLNNIRPNKPDCFNTMVDFPTKNQIHFNNYLKMQNAFIGRKWLLSELESKLMKSEKGVLITAEMGYGKSALVSNIACMDVLSPGYMIRERLVGLHICQFKILSTLDPVLFIMNLAGTLRKHIPNYSKTMMTDENAKKFYENDGKRCYEDPVGCFDAVIRYPLKEIKLDPSHDMWFVIIDGIDECESNYGTNGIYEVLTAQIGQLQLSIKFLLTSRNLETIISDFSLLEHYHLDSNDPRNTNDIKEMTHIAARQTLMFHRFISMFRSNNAEIENVVEMVKGNFLVLTSVIEHMAKFPDANLIYQFGALDKFFLDQLKRVFGNNGEYFYKVRGIFEILCTSFKPLAENQLLQMAQIDSNPTSEHYMYDILQLLGRELGHFIARRGHGISLIHYTLIDFLTNVSRSHLPFFVSKANGHLKFAKYLIVELEHPNTTFIHFDIIEIITHVVNSEDNKIISEFRNKTFLFRQTLSSINSKETLLHYSVRRMNSYLGMDLVIDIVGKHQVNALNNRQVTALFIGAAYGHTESVKSLLDNGADIEFKSTSLHTPMFLDPSNQLSFCKTVVFIGYNVLHISAQNGHRETVKEILFRNQTLMYEKNEIGLIPFQLAVEFGHVNIMKIFLELNSSLSDQHSLYYASLRGHLEAVKLLYDYGIKQECPVCNGSMYWVRTEDVRKHSCRSILHNTLLKDMTFKYRTYTEHLAFIRFPLNYLPGGWHLITCESPMNAAVRNGFTDVVNFFIETENALELFSCRTYDGGSPILTAVRYNRSNMFQLLLKNGANNNERYRSKMFLDDGFSDDELLYDDLDNFDSLSKNKVQVYGINQENTLYPYGLEDKENVDTSIGNFDMSELDYFLEGATVAHILARYADFYMIHQFDAFIQNWNSTDIHDNTPLHYAAMFNNSVMVSFLLQTNQYKTVPLTKQLMTPFHVAALSKSYESIYMLEKGYGFITNLLDKKGRTVIQCMLLLGYNATLPLHNYIIPSSLSVKNVIVFTLDRSVSLLNHRDLKGFNLFHYAGMNGHYYVLNAVREKISKSDFHSLLTSMSYSGKTALDIALESTAEKSEQNNVMNTDLCFQHPLYMDVESDILKSILSPYDLFIIHYLRILSKEEALKPDDQKVKLYTEMSLKKALFCVLAEMNTFMGSTFKRIITFHWRDFLNLVKEPMTTSLVMPDTLIKCNVDYLESPLHTIVMTEIKSSSSLFGCSRFVERYLSRYNADFLNNCRDKNEFNLLERAIIGDNTCVMVCLNNFGMTIKNNYEPVSQTFYSILYVTKFSRDVHWIGELPHEHCIKSTYNETMFQVRETFYGGSCQRIVLSFDNSELQVCNLNKPLSLVHLIAVKGLTLCLKTIHEKYGRLSLECRNKHGFTPLYLANFMHQWHAQIYLEKLELKISQPSQLAENLLLMKIYFNFDTSIPGPSFVWKCRNLFVNPTFKSSYSKMKICLQNIYLEHAELLKNLKYLDNLNFTEVSIPPYAYTELNKDVNTLQDYIQFKRIPNVDNFRKCLSLLTQNGHLDTKCNIIIREFLKWKGHNRHFFKHFMTTIARRCKMVSETYIQVKMIFHCKVMADILSEKTKKILCEESDRYSKLYLSQEFLYLDRLDNPKGRVNELLLQGLLVKYGDVNEYRYRFKRYIHHFDSPLHTNGYDVSNTYPTRPVY